MEPTKKRLRENIGSLLKTTLESILKTFLKQLELNLEPKVSFEVFRRQYRKLSFNRPKVILKHSKTLDSNLVVL